MAKQTIRTTCSDNPVDAKIYGYLAIHKSLQGIEHGNLGLWTVTHVASGYLVGQFISHRRAIQFAKLLGSDPAWALLDSTNPLSPSDHSNPVIAALIERLQEFAGRYDIRYQS